MPDKEHQVLSVEWMESLVWAQAMSSLAFLAYHILGNVCFTQHPIRVVHAFYYFWYVLTATKMSKIH